MTARRFDLQVERRKGYFDASLTLFGFSCGVIWNSYHVRRWAAGLDIGGFGLFVDAGRFIFWAGDDV